MGYQRLGSIPKSAKWDAVVTLLTTTGSSPSSLPKTLAAESLDAAAPALAAANDDLGLRYTFYLLTQLVLAAREADWANRLSAFGVNISDGSTVLDLTTQVQFAIDDYVAKTARPTDISEMAQRAAGEAIASIATDHTLSLFDRTGTDLKSAVRLLSTQRGFSELGQRFFGRFMARFLNFYLSRATAAYIGQSPLGSVGEVTEFNQSLRLHCEQSARIVRDFCGQWYSKTEYQQGVNLENAGRFMAIAVRKLSKELAKQRGEL